MAKINNSNAIRRIIHDAGIQTSIDKVPQELASKVVPVLISNPKPEYYVVESASSSNSAALITLYQTPKDKDFYLTAGTLSMIKDAGSTATGVYLRVTINGVAKSLLRIPSITLTAHSEAISITPIEPLKIDRNSLITLHNGTADAEIISSAHITGFIV